MNDNRRSSLRNPHSHRESLSKRAPPKAPSDSDLVVKYIDKLNEVLEENKNLEKKIKEKEQIIINIQKNPNRFIKNFNCDKCNFHQMEIEDYLNQLLNSKKKFDKFKKEKNKKKAGIENYKYENLYITSEFEIEFKNFNKNKSREDLCKENFSFELKTISINKA